MPKFLVNRPTGRVPHVLRRPIFRLFCEFVRSRSRAVGLPVPHFRDGWVVPIVGGQLHYHYSHGHIEHRGDVVHVDGDRVTFAEGAEEQVDLVVMATGFLPSYPSIDRKLVNWPKDALKPSLYLHIVPPETRNLFVVGMVRPMSSHWAIYDKQAHFIADYLTAGDTTAFDTAKHGPQPDLQAGIPVYNSDQYRLIVDRQEYIDVLRRHTPMLKR
ncbi:hypothetical protein [Sinosporangium siamense]|uniref:Monooxygenase n=1 Tax=Sinosporangium siamense TaxID=1367973 RepID=A0A919VE87_9ACTN|nr:hypothetical protein [Sinosporangium siamense]GII94879.1 hypothetical protein Ssi02_51100 [Sinosporangium siamense]